MNSMNPNFYDVGDPAAERSRKRDDEFFAAHPKQVWRVRPLLEGESPVIDEMRQELGCRAYALVLDHARAGDRRAKHGRGIYPIVVRSGDKDEIRRLLTEEALRFAKWFKRHPTTPPPTPGVVMVTGSAA